MLLKTVDDYVAFFEAIPEECWPRNTLGAVGCLPSPDHAYILAKLMGLKSFCQVQNITDGSHKRYQQSTQKQRLIAALLDMKENP